MKKNIIYNIVSAAWMLSASLALTSCDDFLSENPNRGENEPLETKQQVEALFDNSQYTQHIALGSIFSSDDFEMSTDQYSFAPYNFDADILPFYTWGTTDLINSGSDEVWNDEFNKVFTANMVINDIKNVEDATDAEKTDYLAQTHFMRAIAYYELVNLYCMPYSEETKQSLGLPLKTKTSYEEDLSRASLADTYQFIIADLDEAEKTSHTDISKRWLVSRPAVAAMKARLYLLMGDYAHAQTEAEKALQTTQASLQDYNELGHHTSYAYNMNGEEVEISYSGLMDMSALEYTDYQEMLYSGTYKLYTSMRILPSETLKSLYDPDNDLRYSQFFAKNGSLEYGLEGFGDDLLYRKFFDVNTYYDILPEGPTVGEMLLVKAEAQCRQGDWQNAINTVNTLREKRFATGSDYALEATSQEDALTKILDERHRELPFTMRWYDIRRFAFNETASDDVTISRSFYKVANKQVDFDNIEDYTLPVKSKRYAQPLPQTEISRSHGQLKQNKY